MSFDVLSDTIVERMCGLARAQDELGWLEQRGYPAPQSVALNDADADWVDVALVWPNCSVSYPRWNEPTYRRVLADIWTPCTRDEFLAMIAPMDTAGTLAPGGGLTMTIIPGPGRRVSDDGTTTVPV